MSVPPLVWFLARRILAAVAILFILSFGIFALVYIAPGSVLDALLGFRGRSPDVVAQLRHAYHLDQPFFAQYWYWLDNALHLRLGRSATTGLPVTTSIAQASGITIFLSVYAFTVALVFGVGLGIIAAIRHQSVLDRIVVGISTLGMSAPAFVTGVVLLWIFTVRWKVMPSFGPGAGLSDRFVHLTLPAIALALPVLAPILKLTRASMVETLAQDYVAFARARGVSRWSVIVTYAFRNACIPVITIAALIVAWLVVGATFVESTFALPGLGSLLLTAATARDIPLVQGMALLAAALVLSANLAADVIYLFADPRIRFGAAAR